MLIQHFFIAKIAHSSYILAGSEYCAVIDPQRDIDIYIDEARELGVVISHVLQTHLHAVKVMVLLLFWIEKAGF